jgi:hypothetical protein
LFFNLNGGDMSNAISSIFTDLTREDFLSNRVNKYPLARIIVAGLVGAVSAAILQSPIGPGTGAVVTACSSIVGDSGYGLSRLFKYDLRTSVITAIAVTLFARIAFCFAVGMSLKAVLAFNLVSVLIGLPIAIVGGRVLGALENSLEQRRASIIDVVSL